MLQKPNYQHIYAIISKSTPPILTKFSEDVHLTQTIKNQLSKQRALKILFTKSAVCLQNTFLPIPSQPLTTEKNFLASNARHP